MFVFDLDLEKQQILSETLSPALDGWNGFSEHFSISFKPNVPTS